MTTAKNQFEILVESINAEHQSVLQEATVLASNLASAVKLIHAALEKGDLKNLALWTQGHDMELATRVKVLHAQLRLIESLK
jgi:hypothetical protein